MAKTQSHSVKIDLKFKNKAPKKKEKNQVLILPIFEGENNIGILGKEAKKFDTSYAGALEKKLLETAGFTGKIGQTTSVRPANSHYKNIIFVGMGKTEELTKVRAEYLGRQLYKKLDASTEKNYVFMTEDHKDLKDKPADTYVAFASGLYEASYNFDRHKAKGKQKDTTSLTLIGPKSEFQTAFKASNATNKGQVWAKDLGNEPPNVLYPEHYAERIESTLKPLGVKTRLISYQDMQDIGMEAALAVGGSAANKPCMMIMEYDGTNGAADRPVGLVGKGLTFDTGGYSLKPSSGQRGMKFDMCGSAAVVGAVHALAEKKAPVKVAAIVGLVENRISNDAYLVDDVIGSLAGHSIEVGNTDAEGRLVLADAMTYLQREYNPHTMVDLATLTGAVKQALGTHRAGMFTETPSLSKEFEKAADKSGELLWHLPLDPIHKNIVQGKVADLTNSSGIGLGGASQAAAFLSHFVEGDTKWLHLDIAGTASTAKEATGYGVKLLCEWVEENYSQKAIKPSKGQPKPKQ